MIYLDSAAIVKLVRAEAETAALVDWLNARPQSPRFTSALAEIEVPRALRRVAPEALHAVPAVMAHLYRLEIDATVRSVAATLDDPLLRSLDAIHLATAILVARRDGVIIDAFVTYDQRLLGAAEKADLPTASPK
ncbi:type II toxin-antitoxin system VapC family toxin [Frankia sp. AgB1.9]|uniref:type II toxin-antitoxin system VapC family toxin n=1 Tax=unclassified Frankia TaxID=2632575 RepID=UPI001933F94D|nr:MULTISPECIES: type II toxin-antitoxin system VapC family toxin [unclassified Frankia]MBL7493468.1 type II toxin-antitoxin system VapC family toxin [Frankia sp. AgW1.1]MBL7549037.1 type II toxin-antitoxin system VapC family toxin [Frankia sp. AgB1.9]MBL7619998.1 type II toxin-antitoxin system VapC family toxin [Frankia sp. AgB1.8]